MIHVIKTFFGFQSKKDSNFSKFFRNSSSNEKKKVIKKVIREANNDQKKLMDKAAKLSTQNH